MYSSELTKLGFDLGGRVSGEKKLDCPVCKSKKKSLSVNITTGLYKCHYSKCDYKGFAGSIKEKKEYKKPDQKREKPSDLLYDYMLGRGIKKETVDDLKISLGKRGSIRFNYYDQDELVNWKERGIKEKTFGQFPGARKMLYNINSIKGKSKAIITEGEIDTATWSQIVDKDEIGVVSLDQGAIAVDGNPGGKFDSIANGADYILKIQEWYICLDADAPGKYTALKLAERLGKHRCFLVLLPEGCKDANDCFQKFGIDGGTKKLMDAFDNAVALTDGITFLDEDMIDLLLHENEHGMKRGDTTHFKEFDELFTYVDGQITLFTGYPGSGKSEFTRTLMMIKSVRDGWKWGCYCPEESPARSFYYTLATVMLGKTKGILRKELADALGFIKDHFFYIEPSDITDGQIVLPDNKWINERLTLLRLKHGINGFMKDPWNKIFHRMQRGEREDQYLQMELSKEKLFAESFQAPLYIAHPNSGGSSKDIRKLSPPGPTNINGGAMFWNMMDNMITVHRERDNEEFGGEDSKIVKIIVNKIRKKRITGKEGEVRLIYEYEENRYYEGVDKRVSPFGEDWIDASLDLPF